MRLPGVGSAETKEEAKRLAGPGGLYWKAEDMRWAAKWSFFICLAIALIALAVLIHYEPAFAQEKAPQLSADSRVTILKVQLHQKDLESRYLQAQQQMTAIQNEFTQTQATLQAAIDAAYKDAKLEKKDWNLDVNTLEFVKVPAAPKAEAKKPQ